MDELDAGKFCQLGERVSERIGAGKYRTWFGERTEFAFDGRRLTVTAPSAFVATWIASNYLTDIGAVARDLLGGEPDVEVRINTNGHKNAPRDGRAALPTAAVRAAPPAPARPRDAESVMLRGDLDNFVVGQSNALAHSAALKIVAAPNRSFAPIVLHSRCGLGKTHLLQGICNGVRRRHPALQWRYVSGEEFTNEFIYAVKSGKIDQFRTRFRTFDLLVIDDIHFLANKRATQEEFLHTFNAIDASGKSIVLASDRHPSAIATLSEPLINRLISGMVIEIEPPDFLMRREIIRRRAEAMHAAISPDVLDFVARHVTRNVRELEGAIYKLVALAALNKQPVTIEMARIALEHGAAREGTAPQAVDIEQCVAAYFDVSREQLHSRTRDRTVTLARAVAMYLVRRRTRASFPEIGRIMGGKNHSTVLMATQRMEEVLKANGLVSWKTRTDAREARLSEVLESIECSLRPRRD